MLRKVLGDQSVLGQVYGWVCPLPDPVSNSPRVYWTDSELVGDLSDNCRLCDIFLGKAADVKNLQSSLQTRFWFSHPRLGGGQGVSPATAGKLIIGVLVGTATGLLLWRWYRSAWTWHDWLAYAKRIDVQRYTRDLGYHEEIAEGELDVYHGEGLQSLEYSRVGIWGFRRKFELIHQKATVGAKVKEVVEEDRVEMVEELYQVSVPHYQADEDGNLTFIGMIDNIQFVRDVEKKIPKPPQAKSQVEDVKDRPKRVLSKIVVKYTQLTKARFGTPLRTSANREAIRRYIHNAMTNDDVRYVDQFKYIDHVLALTFYPTDHEIYFAHLPDAPDAVARTKALCAPPVE